MDEVEGFGIIEEAMNCAYPFAVVRINGSWSAGALQWQAALAADSREELDRLMAEQVALHRHDEQMAGRTPEPPKPERELDLGLYREIGQEFEVVYARPAPLSSGAIAIERALVEDGVSQAELARRMGVPRSTVSRITDPLYFGHTSNTLREVAEVLGRELRIELVTPGEEQASPQRWLPG